MGSPSSWMSSKLPWLAILMVCGLLSVREYYFRPPSPSPQPLSYDNLKMTPPVEIVTSIRSIETKLQKIPATDFTSDLKAIQEKLDKIPSIDMTSIESKLDSYAKTLSELSGKLEKLGGQTSAVANTSPQAAIVPKGCELADAYKKVYQELQRDYCLHDYVEGGTPIVQQDFHPVPYDGVEGDSTLKLFVYKDTSRDVVSSRK